MSTYNEKIIKTTDSSGTRVRTIIGKDKTKAPPEQKESVKVGDSPDMVITTNTPNSNGGVF